MQPNNTPPLGMYTFDGGRVITQAVRFLAPDGSDEHRDMADPNHAYLIQHSKGLMVWDTGLSDSITQRANHTLERGRFNFVVETPLTAQMAEIGVSPADVNYLSFSHLQIDHAGNAGLFPNATVLIQANEYTHAFSPDAEEWGYNPPDYSALKDRNVVQLTGDYDVFGDGRVVILSAPGHTPGHQVLFVDLPHCGAVLLSGDLYYASKDPAEGWMPAWNFDKAETRRTMARLEKFAAARGARWIINHNPEGQACGWTD